MIIKKIKKMRENADIKVVGKNVILIPYDAKHVEKYEKQNAASNDSK